LVFSSISLSAADATPQRGHIVPQQAQDVQLSVDQFFECNIVMLCYGGEADMDFAFVVLRSDINGGAGFRH
jgi:hypothetical protein